ncbi:MAG TPA: CDP-diacylglycerol--glycerol-3-phosphate 3-phosphatidyltransferase [Spirochaetota bacterium]|nr:CDP-diacylglycerol--glycerol-3-phosphate 3-phosphatidyltransferase [Spirochaetota bacterium]HQO01911.1 CDP-diacylglycerol--glycerol-3-phosphate 3-phosphatidyltransferase [Spirochaetota bacterium]HQP49100.1 CDP-diacylglycerol--glycerol-3-phosphate 3-phosphatidyltransferase [Spirochaetota bacterium]
MNVRVFNIPNMLSILRIVLIPLFLYLIFKRTGEALMWGLAVFIIASFTDLLDGWSARKLQQETSIGQFLDPLADKFLVISAFLALLYLDPLIPFWMIVIIVARDLLITVMRYLAIRKGTVLKTSRFGKVKTAFQMFSIVVILMVFYFRFSGVNVAHSFDMDGYIKLDVVLEILLSDHPDKLLIVSPYLMMLIVTIMTALSGIRYFFTNWRILLPPYSAVEGE